MNKNETNQKQDKQSRCTLSVKLSTKSNVRKFLERVNKKEDCGKITPDALINYLLEKMTGEDIENLQLQTITWEHEDKRLRRIWEKKKGKISDHKWKEMLYTGQLASFASDNLNLPGFGGHLFL